MAPGKNRLRSRTQLHVSINFLALWFCHLYTWNEELMGFSSGLQAEKKKQTTHPHLWLVAGSWDTLSGDWGSKEAVWGEVWTQITLPSLPCCQGTFENLPVGPRKADFNEQGDAYMITNRIYQCTYLLIPKTSPLIGIGGASMGLVTIHCFLLTGGWSPSQGMKEGQAEAEASVKVYHQKSSTCCCPHRGLAFLPSESTLSHGWL